MLLEGERAAGRKLKGINKIQTRNTLKTRKHTQNTRKHTINKTLTGHPQDTHETHKTHTKEHAKIKKKSANRGKLRLVDGIPPAPSLSAGKKGRIWRVHQIEAPDLLACPKDKYGFFHLAGSGHRFFFIGPGIRYGTGPVRSGPVRFGGHEKCVCQVYSPTVVIYHFLSKALPGSLDWGNYVGFSVQVATEHTFSAWMHWNRKKNKTRASIFLNSPVVFLKCSLFSHTIYRPILLIILCRTLN